MYLFLVLLLNQPLYERVQPSGKSEEVVSFLLLSNRLSSLTAAQFSSLCCAVSLPAGTSLSSRGTFLGSPRSLVKAACALEFTSPRLDPAAFLPVSGYSCPFRVPRGTAWLQGQWLLSAGSQAVPVVSLTPS